MNLKIIRPISIIIVLIIPILIGAYIEYSVYCGKYLFTVKNLHEISLSLVQIQPTMTTLIIAVIALLSGTTSKSYFGISVNSYYLENKPRILKFKTVLIYEFILIALSLIGHTFGYYNFVITVFTTASFIILFFVLQIFDVYKGKKRVVDDIKPYFEKLIENTDKYKDLGQKFVSDWKAIASTQTQDEFDEYFRLHIKLISRIIKKDKDTDVANVLNETMAMHLLKCENLLTRIKGLEYVINVYNKLSDLFIQESIREGIPDKKIELICRVENEWQNAVYALKIKDLENLKIGLFLRNVLIVAAYTKNETEKEIAQEIGYTMGFILNTQKKQGCIINPFHWCELININHNDLFFQNSSQRLSKEILRYEAILNFKLCKGYLLNGQINLVKVAIFQKVPSIINLLNDQKLSKDQFSAIILEILLIHCFMYHVSFRIDPTFIKSNIQKEIKKLISDSDVVENTEHIILQLILRPDFLTEELEHTMEGMINECQSYNNEERFDEVIECVQKNVVKEYFLYIVLMVSVYKNLSVLELLNTTEYKVYISDEMQKCLEKNFSELGKVLAPYRYDIKKMLNSFNQFMRNEIKKSTIEKVNENYIEFKKDEIQTRIERGLRENFEKYFGVFGEPRDIPEENIDNHQDIPLFKLQDFIESLNKGIDACYFETPFVNLINFISSKLKMLGVDEKNRSNDFKNDLEFKDFIENGNYNILIGNQSLFSQIDYCNSNSDFLNSKQLIAIPNSKVGIATNKGEIYIKLDDVKIDIQAPKLEQIDPMDYSKNEETGVITYPKDDTFSSEYSEREFEELIKKERVIISIYFRLTFGVNQPHLQKQSPTISLIKCSY